MRTSYVFGKQLSVQDIGFLLLGFLCGVLCHHQYSSTHEKTSCCVHVKLFLIWSRFASQAESLGSPEFSSLLVLIYFEIMT